MNKKNLIKGLKVAIDVLTNDTIKYDWHKPKHCNCGVVASCVVNYDYDKFKNLIKNTFNEAQREGVSSTPDRSPTWRDVAQNYCSVTGKSNYIIFQELAKAGLTPKDIVHLEFLSNAAILESSGIKKENIVKKVADGTKKTIVPENYTKIVSKKVTVDEVIKVPSTKWFGKLFGLTTQKTIKVEKIIDTPVTLVRDVEKTVQMYKDVIVGQKYPDKYYTKKTNLILYLKGWVKILESEKTEIKPDVNKLELEKQLLIATAEENYEKAAELRDLINK